MTGYRKKIAYLDYLENGMKIGNAGFVRIEDSNGQTRLELRAKNIPEAFGGQYELKTNAGSVAGRISISRGCGSCCLVWKNSALALGGKRMEQTDGVYIRLPGRRLLQAVWDEPIGICVEGKDAEEAADIGKAADDKKAAGIGKAAGDKEDGAERTVAEENCAKEAGEEGAAVKEAGSEADGREKGAAQAVYETEEAVYETGIAALQTEEGRKEEKGTDGGEGLAEDARPKNGEGSEREKRPGRDVQEQVCYGDKWEQLCHMYAVIHPFGDDREYLSITPGDFVVMRQEYQKMVHNSFLLHGYYNYKHLILGRIREKEGVGYYLGVPGNFYGREKMVAEMFGFEAFEGEKEPAGAGDFGYFMKRVEI